MIPSSVFRLDSPSVSSVRGMDGISHVDPVQRGPGSGQAATQVVGYPRLSETIGER